MEMSVREARAQFAHALDAAAKGERVTITRNGKPIAEIGPPTPVQDRVTDPEELQRIREEIGIKKPDFPLDEAWREAFDDPAFGREALGLSDDWEPFRP